MVSRFTERSDELDRDQLRSLSRHTTAARGKPQEQGRYSAVAIGIGFLVVSGALALLYFGAMRMFDVRSLVVTLILTSVATLAVVLPLFVGLSASGAAFRDPSIRVNPGDVIDMALKNSWWGRLFSTFRAGAEDVVTPIREQLIRLAGLGMPAAQRRAVAAVPQSTEFMLGIAVEAEFHQLPEPDRIYFADVPNVVQRLRETGVRIRKNVQRDAGNAIRLATVTAALDDLRLTLVKLRAGSISEGDLTASIKEIEAIGRRVDAELEARAEVAAMLRAEKSK